MILYLYADHTAYLRDDRSSTVRTVPDTAGTLVIGAVSMTIRADSVPVIPSFSEHGGRLSGEFISDTGIRYPVLHLRTNTRGYPVSCLDYGALLLDLRAKLDAVEILAGELSREVHRLRGIYEKDALYFLKKHSQIPKEHSDKEEITP